MIKLLALNSLRNPVVSAATNRSHKVNPKKIMLLYINNDSVPFTCAVFARTEPYIPNQKRIDNGLVIDMTNPVIKHFSNDSLFLLNEKEIFFELIIPSIPVYIRIKPPKSQRKICTTGIPKNWTIPKYTRSIKKASAIIDPAPTIQACQNPFFIPLSNLAEFTGPIGAASVKPRKM